MYRRFRALGFPAIVLLAAATAPLALAFQAGPNQLKFTQRETDLQRLVGQPALPEPVAKGRVLWVQRCALCHDPVAASGKVPGPWLDREIVRARGEARVREKIATGSARMPGFQYALQPKQVDHLIAFLNTVTPDQKPQ